MHGFTNNGTIWPSPIGLAASFNAPLLEAAAETIGTEAEGLGFHQLFAPVLDLSRELRWGRVEENYGEDPFLYVSHSAFQTLLRRWGAHGGVAGRERWARRTCAESRTGDEGTRARRQLRASRRRASISRRTDPPKAACELLSSVRPIANSDRTLLYRNLAQVSGGERELRTYYLKPFERACAAINPAVEGGATALSLMSAYASYDGIPTVANYRE